MPSSDFPVTDLDDLKLANSPPASSFNTSSGGKKAKKKGKKQTRPRVEDGDDTPYAKSITPSPPVAAVDHDLVLEEPTLPGISTKLDKDDTWYKYATEAEDLAVPVDNDVFQALPPVSGGKLIDDFGDDTTAYEDPDPPPKPLKRPSSAVITPPAVSPRLQNVKAANISPASPPTRFASLAGTRDALAGPRRTSLHHEHTTRRGSILDAASPNLRPSFLEAPPPHMAQAHFFSAPDLGFNLTTEKVDKGKLAGSGAYCCNFDSFADTGDFASAKRAKDALLVGWEGGLDVYRVIADKMEVVGRLEGLRGGVVGAKILPASATPDTLHTQHPFIALIIHGPTQDHKAVSALNGTLENGNHGAIYQTTVDVFSLQTQKLIVTLYRSLPRMTPQPKLGELASAPDPIGDLRLDVKGRFLTIASGTSGEVFVFTTSTNRDDDGETSFACIGKFWTTLQTRFDINQRPMSAEGSLIGVEADDPKTAPLLSLSSRWLVIVCPSTSSKISIQGTPLLSSTFTHLIGLNSHAAPAQPPITAEVVGLNAEGTLSRFTRQAAQELLKASRKGIELGWASWREFTHPSPPSRTTNHTRSESVENVFPPTHAPPDDPKRLAREPAVVSIIDLERLREAAQPQVKSSAPLSVSTFALEDGCNFISLSCDGLKVMTTSRRGEVSTIWDLKHLLHGSKKCSGKEEDDDEPHGPYVERLQRIPRNSQSIVLDAAWSRDDDVVALLTAHGTIHLHEVNQQTSSLQKRRRRSTAIASGQENKSDATVGVSQGMSPPSTNGLLGSFRSSWQSVSTQVNAIRSNTPSAQSFGIPTTFAGFKDTANAARAAGGRVVVRGLSQGYSAAKTGVGDMWHADDNKIRHKELLEGSTCASLRWMRRKAGYSIVVACGGKLFLHPTQRVTRQRGEATVTGLKAEKGGRREFGLPPISTARSTNACASQGPHGFWSLRASLPTEHQQRRRGAYAALQTNEVETNPPYCPFHVDVRVSILVFDGSRSFAKKLEEPTEDTLLAQGFDVDAEPWAFGESLPPSIKINNDLSGVSDTERAATDSDAEDYVPEAVMESKTTVHPAGQIRINTRRRRGRRRHEEGGRGGMAEGEFELLEDDDDDSF